ncbi:MAG: hypothetical protein D9C04_04820 [Nitrosopumilus sp. B06]|nr:MAG: hypothetical protein EB828_01150 [Nitrosopumilus sp. D6]RNJ79445.1 MAG: hypothetical protein D9C04_04820 [Nitrosopumilus sp. B06]
MVALVVLVILAVIAYNYSGDLTRQKGLQFGVELEQIQDEIKQIQTRFYSQTTLWREGDLSKEQLLDSYDVHLAEFAEIISRYDKLGPPAIFEGSVDLLKISSQAQMESDSHYLEWIKTGDESARVRSDALLQESLDYEMLGIAEFYAAKSGIIQYDQEQFAPPQTGIAQRVVEVAQTMTDRCNADFKNQSGGFDSEQDSTAWQLCVDAAQKWKEEHLP